MEEKYNCKFYKKCVMPKNDYRCNEAHMHCIVSQKFKALEIKVNGVEPDFIGSATEFHNMIKDKPVKPESDIWGNVKFLDGKLNPAYQEKK